MDLWCGGFPRGTLVSTHDGMERRIETLKKGDVLQGGAKVACLIRVEQTEGTLAQLPGGLVLSVSQTVVQDGRVKNPMTVPGAVELSEAGMTTFAVIVDRDIRVEGWVCRPHLRNLEAFIAYDPVGWVAGLIVL